MKMTLRHIQNGKDTLCVYEATPEKPSKSAIILLPAIAGINDYIKTRAMNLAEEGIHVFLLDYYSREEQAPDCSTPEAIGKAVAGLPDPRVLSDIQAIEKELHANSQIDNDKIGIMGFCIGGMYAFLAACESSGFACAISYYGSLIYDQKSENKPFAPMDRIEDLRAPVLTHFGTFDRLISEQQMDDFEAALRQAQKLYECFRYRGAPHAFDEFFRAPVYRPTASANAWRNTLTFLHWHLHAQR
ncbi:MAG: dienelactone hydrolase family protein [Myxococcota bacterium]